MAFVSSSEKLDKLENTARTHTHTAFLSVWFTHTLNPDSIPRFSFSSSSSSPPFSSFSFSYWTHHGDGIVEQALAKDDDVDLLVDADVLEYVERRHGVDSRDDGGKQQVLLRGGKHHGETQWLLASVEKHSSSTWQIKTSFPWWPVAASRLT